MKTQINNIFRGGGLLAALFLMGTSSVYAATAADTDITNTASVTFRTAVGGTFDQDGTGDTDTFETDRLVDLTVTGTANVLVVPGQTGTKVRSYEVTNTTNDTIDLVLTLEDLGSDQFDDAVADILWEAGAGGVYAGTENNPNAGNGTTEWVDNLAAGATVTVHVITTVAIGGTTNGDLDSLYLVARGANSSATDLATANAAVFTESGADTQGTVDNTLADADGPATADGARDGRHSDDTSYEVRTASIALVKTSFVVSDPVNCSAFDGAQDLTATCTNPKRIPGARIVYKLAVVNQNTAENIDATLVNIQDLLDANTTYVTGSLYRISSTEAGYAATTCYSGGGDLTDANDDPDTGAGGSVNQLGSVSGSTVTFAEQAGLTETNAVVYCYKVTVN